VLPDYDRTFLLNLAALWVAVMVVMLLVGQPWGSLAVLLLGTCFLGISAWVFREDVTETLDEWREDLPEWWREFSDGVAEWVADRLVAISQWIMGWHDAIQDWRSSRSQATV
jgi:predicted PurR-regulated permease PerM